MFTVDAVLFDLDGTLVDTSAAFVASWREVAAQLELPFEAFAPHLHGIPSGQVLALSAPDLPTADRQRLVARLLTRQVELASAVVALPGARELLASLPPGRWAIVTSGPRRLAEASVAKAGLPRPAVLITADDVEHGKPAPDPFLAAADALGVAIGHCLVVEDSPAGMTGGQAAGAQLLALTTTIPAQSVPGVDWWIPDLRAVKMVDSQHGLEVTIDQ